MDRPGAGRRANAANSAARATGGPQRREHRTGTAKLATFAKQTVNGVTAVSPTALFDKPPVSSVSLPLNRKTTVNARETVPLDAVEADLEDEPFDIDEDLENADWPKAAGDDGSGVAPGLIGERDESDQRERDPRTKKKDAASGCGARSLR